MNKQLEFLQRDGSVILINADDILGIAYTNDGSMLVTEDATEDERGIIVKFSTENMVLQFREGSEITMITDAENLTRRFSQHLTPNSEH